jgi:hypothetical protein
MMFMTLLIAERHLPCNPGNGHGAEKADSGLTGGERATILSAPKGSNWVLETLAASTA